jgi:hypothetical protein
MFLTEAVDDAARAAFAEAEKKDGADAKKRGDQVLTTDDILPLTTYVMIRARVPHLQANLEYLTHFKCTAPELSLSHLQVHLANFQGAFEYISSGKLHTPTHATPRKQRLDSMDDPQSPLSPPHGGHTHSHSTPPDFDLRSTPSSSTSSSTSRTTAAPGSNNGKSSTTVVPSQSSLSASELSASVTDFGYDAYGKGPLRSTIDQAAPRHSRGSSTASTSSDRESKSHHHSNSSGSNGFVPPPSSKRPGRGRPSRGAARDDDDDPPSISALRMDDGNLIVSHSFFTHSPFGLHYSCYACLRNRPIA